MFFVVRDGHYHPVGGMTFRRFLEEGWQGQRATMRDWEMHLSTLFPEVRLKRYIEVRGADSAPLPFAQALAALWRGPARRSARRARRPGRWWPAGPTSSGCACGARCPPRAWPCAVGGRPPGRAGGRAGAHRPRPAWAACPRARAISPLLEPLLAYAQAGRCPADDMLDDYAAATAIRKLVAAWEFRAEAAVRRQSRGIVPDPELAAVDCELTL